MSDNQPNAVIGWLLHVSTGKTDIERLLRIIDDDNGQCYQNQA